MAVCLGMEPDGGRLADHHRRGAAGRACKLTTFIRQTTQGRGWFTTEFARYETLPEMLVPAVVEQAKKLGKQLGQLEASGFPVPPLWIRMRSKFLRSSK